MTKDKDRKQKIRARMEADGVPYTEAARRVGAGEPAVPPERQREVRSRWALGHISQAEAEILIARDAAGLPAPPPRWRSVLPEMVSTYRHPAGDVRVIEVLDARTDRVIARITVPWQEPDELEAGYREDMTTGTGEGYVSGYDLPKVRLGRPDLVVHQLGWESLADWSEWPDGTWRCAARPFGRRHMVRAAPLHPGQLTIGTIMVQERGLGGRVVADEILTPVDPHDRDALDAALDALGWTVDRWEVLPGRARYGAALPGHLAERDWWTLARVRIVRETTVGAVDPRTDRTFRPGEVVTMNQRGRAGREVDRSAWWSSTDIDGAHIIRAECCEVVEVLEDHPPAWDDAALDPELVTGLLAPHHPGAAEAVQAWAGAGLHLSWCHGGIAIRTPAPERRLVGEVRRDYWKGKQFTLPYEAILDDQEWCPSRRKAGQLPLDPVAAAGAAGTAS